MSDLEYRLKLAEETADSYANEAKELREALVRQRRSLCEESDVLLMERNALRDLVLRIVEHAHKQPYWPGIYDFQPEVDALCPWRHPSTRR